jgi:hypothetical protein
MSEQYEKTYDEMTYEEKAVVHAQWAAEKVRSEYEVAFIHSQLANTFAVLNASVVQKRAVAAMESIVPQEVLNE